jgi:hypothetical protein
MSSEIPHHPPAEAAAADGGADASPADGAAATGSEVISKIGEISTGKELQKSVKEAFTEAPTEANSHYIKGYNDKEVHLGIIFLLIVVPATLYFAWKQQVQCDETTPSHKPLDPLVTFTVISQNSQTALHNP